MINWKEATKEEREHIKIGLRRLSSHIAHLATMGTLKVYDKELVDDMIIEINKVKDKDNDR